MNKAKKGFTLVEIMIVVAILAILAAIAIPNFITYRKTAAANACKANIKQVQSAIEAFSIKYPTVQPSTENLVDTASGQFLKKFPTCPRSGAVYSIATDNKGGWTVTCPNADTDGTEFSHTAD